MTRVLTVVLSAFFALSAMAQVADLRATITSLPREVRPGAEVVFTAEIENLGPNAAESTVTTMWFGPTVCHEGLTLGTLQPGEKRSFTCKGAAPPSPPFYGFRSEIHVVADTHDPNRENNAAIGVVQMLTPPDLFVFTNTQGLRVPGLPFTTTIRYGNRASVAAMSGVITITSPTEIVRAPETCTITGTRAVCSVGRVEQGFTDFDIETTAPETSGTPIAIVLEIAAAEGENAADDNRYVTEYNVTYTTFFVTNTSDGGNGSLRAAIEAANATCRDPRLQCMIAFRIPGDGIAQQAIALEGPLPYIMAYNMTVDGGTQRSFFGNTVVLRGEALSSGEAVVLATACSATVRDLTIEDFPGVAISAHLLEPCQNDPFAARRIERNVLRRNGRGIWIDRPLMTVTNNEIRDHDRAGIYIRSGKSFVFENTIRGNRASGIFVGTAGAGTDIRRNTINGNAHFGVAIDRFALNVSVSENRIYGNNEMPIDYGLDGLSTVEPVPPPQITSVRDDGGETVIEATSNAGGTFQPILEIVAADAPHPRGFAEARELVGVAQYDPATRVWRLRARADLRGKWVAATATRSIFIGWSRAPRAEGDTGDFFTTTSEFSLPVEVK